MEDDKDGDGNVEGNHKQNDGDKDKDGEEGANMKMLWGKRLRMSGKEKKGDKNEDTEQEISHSSAQLASLSLSQYIKALA